MDLTQYQTEMLRNVLFLEYTRSCRYRLNGRVSLDFLMYQIFDDGLIEDFDPYNQEQHKYQGESFRRFIVGIFDTVTGKYIFPVPSKAKLSKMWSYVEEKGLITAFDLLEHTLSYPQALAYAAQHGLKSNVDQNTIPAALRGYYLAEYEDESGKHRVIKHFTKIREEQAFRVNAVDMVLSAEENNNAVSHTLTQAFVSVSGYLGHVFNSVDENGSKGHQAIGDIVWDKKERSILEFTVKAGDANRDLTFTKVTNRLHVLQLDDTMSRLSL